MMVRFYLLDYMESSRRMAKRLVAEYVEEVGALEHVEFEEVDGEYETFGDRLQLEADVRNVYLLAIDLGSKVIDGLRVAKEIRGKDSEGYIIFLTSHLEFVSMSYNLNLRALNYIYKNDPNLRDNLFGSLEVIHEELKNLSSKVVETGSTLVIKENRMIRKVYQNKILYVETHPEKRGTRIHTVDEAYDSHDSIKTVGDKLDDSFYQCHRSYIVNVDKIQALESEGQSYVGVLPGGKQCYISKKHYPVIVDAFVKS